jgi:hypothetical protein
MSLVEKRESTVSSLSLSVACNRLTAEHILAFAQALVENDVPPSALISASVNHSTLHCTGLSVRTTEDLTP